MTSMLFNVNTDWCLFYDTTCQHTILTSRLIQVTLYCS